jgi:hypothetical protein
VGLFSSTVERAQADRRTLADLALPIASLMCDMAISRQRNTATEWRDVETLNLSPNIASACSFLTERT